MSTETNPSAMQSYGEIGKLLRNARLGNRMSVEQAARLLHIRPRYIEALESGDLTALPGLAYTRGYLQSYAAFLGLDKEEILRRFEEIEEILGRKSFYFPQVFSKDKSPSNYMVWGGLGVAVAMYMIWAVFLYPAAPTVSLVEKLPPPKTTVKISAETLRNVACLQDSDLLYPPCTMVNGPNVRLTPLHGPRKSVMELLPSTY